MTFCQDLTIKYSGNKIEIKIELTYAFSNRIPVWKPGRSDIKRFFALDDYYDSDRKAYYSALKSVDQKTLDLTQWLEYFTEGVKLSILKVKERVLQLSIEKGRIERKGQIALNERQMKIIEFIQSNGRITSADIQKMFKISRQAAYKEIRKLLQLEIVEQQGSGKGIFYAFK